MRKLPAKKKPAVKKKSKVKNVVPKQYAGVQYKSSLEAHMAQALMEAGLPVNYETWKVVLHQKLQSQVESWEPKTRKNKEAGIKVRTFAPVSQNLRQAVYTPDFVCLEEGWVVETKGLRDSSFNARWRGFLQYLATNNMHHFRVYMPGNNNEIQATVQHILSNRKT